MTSRMTGSARRRCRSAWPIFSLSILAPKYNEVFMHTQSDTTLNTRRDQFRRLPVLIAVATVDMVGGAMVFPLIPVYQVKLHASPTTIAMIISPFFVAQWLPAPISGRV